MDFVFVFGLVVLCLGLLLLPPLPLPTSAQTCAPPTLPTGSTWEPSPDCVGVKNNATYKCHCWGHCGYICTKISSTPTTPTPATPNTSQTCQPENAGGPTGGNLPAGATWVPGPNCTFGGRPGAVINSPVLGRCRCYEFCGYICTPQPTS